MKIAILGILFVLLAVLVLTRETVAANKTYTSPRRTIYYDVDEDAKLKFVLHMSRYLLQDKQFNDLTGLFENHMNGSDLQDAIETAYLTEDKLRMEKRHFILENSAVPKLKAINSTQVKTLAQDLANEASRRLSLEIFDKTKAEYAAVMSTLVDNLTAILTKDIQEAQQRTRDLVITNVIEIDQKEKAAYKNRTESLENKNKTNPVDIPFQNSSQEQNGGNFEDYESLVDFYNFNLMMLYPIYIHSIAEGLMYHVIKYTIFNFVSQSVEAWNEAYVNWWED